MSKKPEKDFTDELIRFTIHEYDFERLPKKLKASIEEYRDIELYPGGLKRGKKFDKPTEFKRLIKEYLKEIKKNKGEESNIECMIASQMIELLQRMMAYDIRKLGLEKLL